MRWVMPLVVLLAILAVVGAGVYLMWDLDWRWRPHTLTKNQAEISQSLAQAGWVSPHLPGPKLYAIVYRDCAACEDVEKQLFPKLQAAQVDTRVIVIARPDANGQALSTPAERNTVAELWTNRSWKLWQQWSLATPATWTAPGLAPADGDAARSAVIEVGRSLVTTLTPQLAASGVKFDDPALVWWTRSGEMHACACTDPRTYGAVLKELGA